MKQLETDPGTLKLIPNLAFEIVRNFPVVVFSNKGKQITQDANHNHTYWRETSVLCNYFSHTVCSFFPRIVAIYILLVPLFTLRGLRRLSSPVYCRRCLCFTMASACTSEL